MIRLDDYINKTIDCACGRKHVIATRETLIGHGIIPALPGFLKKHCPGRKLSLVYDENTFRAAGKVIKETLDSSFVINEILLKTEKGNVKPDEQTLKHLLSRVDSKTGFLLAVGSGTINDLVKFSADRKKIPYAVFATACSMNGYTSAIAVITRHGLKLTMPARPPVAIAGDIDVLSKAPAEMTRAGLADFSARPLANTDWKIASIIRGGYFCDLPYGILREAETECFSSAEAIGRQELEAVDLLFRTLLVSGISMVIAGSSAPASGGEHLISHYWDTMREIGYPVKYNLHGIQVGVASVEVSKIYQKIAKLPPEKIRTSGLERKYPAFAEIKKELKKHFGPAGTEIIKKYRSKYLPWDEKKAELEKIKSAFPEIREIIRKMASPPEKIMNVLQKAGAPADIAGLGISRLLLKQALIHGKELRDRYSVLDLADDLNLLKEPIPLT